MSAAPLLSLPMSQTGCSVPHTHNTSAAKTGLSVAVCLPLERCVLCPALFILHQVDRESATPERCGAVESQLFDLFASLGATDEQLDFTVLYASAKQVSVVRIFNCPPGVASKVLSSTGHRASMVKGSVGVLQSAFQSSEQRKLLWCARHHMTE